MKKLCLVLALIFLLTPAWAHANFLLYADANPPDFRWEQNTIFAKWNNFCNILDEFVFADSYLSRPYGISPPYLDLTSGPEVAGAYLGKLYLETVLIVHPVLKINVLNFDNSNPVKHIRLQLAYDYNRSIEDINVFGGVMWAAYFLQKNVQIKPTVYYSAIDINLYPNPNFEIIYLTFGGAGNLVIDQIVLDTQCATHTPIPSSLLLLGPALLGLAGFGIRRKSS